MNTYKECLWVCVTVIALKCNLSCKRGVMHTGTVQIHGCQHKAILIEAIFWVNEL